MANDDLWDTELQISDEDRERTKAEMKAKRDQLNKEITSKEVPLPEKFFPRLKSAYSSIVLDREVPDKEEEYPNCPTGYSAHPPREAMTSTDGPGITHESLTEERPFFTSKDIACDDYIGIEVPIGNQQSRFWENRCPVAAIEAFLMAHKAGVYPPLWALDFLYLKFKEFHDSQGTKSLDGLFGFGRSRGKRFKKIAMDNRNEDLYQEVFYLKEMFNLKTIEAATLVIAKFPATQSDKPPTEESIAYYYEHQWKKKFKSLYDIFAGYPSSEEKCIAHLKTFPKDALEAVAVKNQSIRIHLKKIGQ